MRFAYIDSQGNEVSIPSVDALALRIELGAIGPDTDLYDAQADRWGPAQTHEIFHTLSRDVGGDLGFVAPPPPVVPSAPVGEDEPGGEEPAPVSAAPREAPEDSGPEPDAEPDAGLPSFDFSEPLTFEGGADDEGEAGDAPGATPSGAGEGDLGMDFTLADEPASPAPPASFGDALSMDLAPAFGEEPAPPPAKPADEAPAFDFGDGLELAPEPFGVAEDEGPEESAGSMDFSPGSGFGAMDMEPPLSDFTPEAPPAWMEQDGPEADDGSMSFARGGAAAQEPESPAPPRRPAPEAEDDDGGRPERPKREPRNRPSPPKRTRSKLPMGAILGVVALAVVGGGGYFGWTAMQGGGGQSGPAAVAPTLPAVVIPDIPAEFLPTMRDLGEAALAGTIAELRSLETELGLPIEPNEAWLAGVYLANASQFRDIPAFWEGLESYVALVRERDTAVFHEQYVAQLEAAGITGDTAVMLLERADSGFLATREDRFEAYRLMDDLILAALDLHNFLVRNEANIEYDPAAGGVSRDPVLEAVPASRELGDEMWGMVGRITAALDALGTLDRVTTERLAAVLFDRVRRAGFR